MHLIILKTNVETNERAITLTPAFEAHPEIYRWSFDLEDIDKVLKLETNEGLSEQDMIQLLSTHGFEAEELPD